MTKLESNSVTRVNIVSAISEAADLSQKEADSMLEVILEAITDSLKKGEEVMVSGFGKFVVQSKAARAGRNPKTNEPVEISARRVMKFKPSDALKENINNNWLNHVTAS